MNKTSKAIIHIVSVFRGLACNLVTLAIIILVSVLPGQAAMAHGHERNYGVDLGAQWWQFMNSIPTQDNPLFDGTGAKCVIGQRGDVWFLAGVSGLFDPTTGEVLDAGGKATRSCTIPKGKKLFFPILNGVGFDSPNICGQKENHYSFMDLVGQLTPFIDAAKDMSVTLDGKSLNNFKRIQSGPFEIWLPEGNIQDTQCKAANYGPVPAGIYSPAAQDGYYVMLSPLKIGDHILTFKGSASGFSTEVTYNLKVVPVSRGK